MLHAANAEAVREQTALGKQENLSFASPSVSILVPFLCKRLFLKTSLCANRPSLSVLFQVGQFSEFLHECTSQ